MELVSSVRVWPATEVLSIFVRIRIFIRVTHSLLSNCFDVVISKFGAGINHAQNVQHQEVMSDEGISVFLSNIAAAAAL